MGGHCSTGQSPQWAVVSMEEEEEEEEEEVKNIVEGRYSLATIMFNVVIRRTQVMREM